MTLTLPTTPAKPFLKWAGGKGQLLHQLHANKPTHKFTTYHEPFVGGGALFFSLRPQNAYLSDINPELINAYLAIATQPDEVISELKQHKFDKEYYYQLRDVDLCPLFKLWTPAQKAPRTIALNKSCYNGLYRLNKKQHHFNVPMGRYKNPLLCDEENLTACHHALQKAKIPTTSITTLLDRVAPYDFVYLDPPYQPLNATSNFTSYTGHTFTTADQTQLAHICSELHRRKVFFLLSNSSHPFIHDLYQHFHLTTINAKRSINSKSQKRGKIPEILAQNFYPGTSKFIDLDREAA